MVASGTLLLVTLSFAALASPSSATLVNFGAAVIGAGGPFGTGLHGTVQLDYDSTLHTLRIRYKPVALLPFASVVTGVTDLTGLPFFVPLPALVNTLTATYDVTINLQLPGSYNPPFLASVGNNVPLAETTVVSDFPAQSFFDVFVDIQITPEARGLITPGCVAVCDDPHFTGLNGAQYDFQGAPDQTFALVSDVDVQLNSHFTKHVFEDSARRHHTYTDLGDTCVRVCNETFVFHAGRAVEINGRPLTKPRYESARATVEVIAAVAFVTTDSWAITIEMFDDHININQAVPIGKHSVTHGVLGHTLHHKTDDGWKCNQAEEGGCQVDGKFSDYEVAGDLCSTEWKFARFSSDNCH